MFFEWQREGGWAKHFAGRRELKQLDAFFRMTANAFLRAIGHEEAALGELQTWATVHFNCIEHLAHTHPTNVVSGVYYVATPPTSGPILFHDPRGPLPPFDNTITIEPQAGDVVLFPSWLLHQVAPTSGSDQRISIAFNVPGEWASTTGVAAHLPLEAMLQQGPP
eukprot:m.74782 g.74782  ORF g.74782 m.74782 type:complete len:165 (+) comp13107_c0_seq2:585-1079(+)